MKASSATACRITPELVRAAAGIVDVRFGMPHTVRRHRSWVPDDGRTAMEEKRRDVQGALRAGSLAKDATGGKAPSTMPAILEKDEREVDVLVACTDDDARKIVRLVLQHAGWRVQEETNVAAVVTLALQWHPLLVVISYPTAVGGRCTVTEALRTNPETRSTPILNVTGHAFPFELERAEAAGVTTSLVMPVSLARVVQEVGRLIGPRGTTQRARRFAQRRSFTETEASSERDRAL